MLLQEGSCILRSSWPSGLNVFSKKALQHPHLIRISNACLLFLWRHLLFGSFDFFNDFGFCCNLFVPGHRQNH